MSTREMPFTLQFTGTSCDFESGTMCGWKNSIKDNTDWGVQTGTGQQSGPGPDADHTKNNGNGRQDLD